ncbi:hypothetical protein EDB84DRAFT_946587 [Lactarius hengduanensis]|nr:hypothetical protein EDB84DRAFT_946587 [Lactarius hengduanensis]
MTLMCTAKKRESARKSRVQSFSGPSWIVFCVAYSLVYTSYIENASNECIPHQASLVDFRRFIQEMLLEWSDVNLLATVFFSVRHRRSCDLDKTNGSHTTCRANLSLIILSGLTTFQRTATLAFTFFSLLRIVIGLYRTWEHRIRTNADLDDLSEYIGGKCKATESGWTYWTYSNTTLLASMLSVPIASLLWSVLCFMMAVSASCLQRVDVGSKIILGLEIGTFVVISSDKLRERNK